MMGAEFEGETSKPASLEAIHDFAVSAAEEMRVGAQAVAAGTAAAWQDFRSQLEYRDSKYFTNADLLHKFWHRFGAATRFQPSDGVNSLYQMVNSRGPIESDWYLLSSFLSHDYNHIKPDEFLQTFTHIDYLLLSSPSVGIFERHIHFMDHAVQNMRDIAAMRAFPLDFIAGVSSLENNKALPVETFSPRELFESMAVLIKGRFAEDDYEIYKNTDPTSETTTNRIIVNIPEDLILTTNKSMLFSVVYNLVKNAAKANLKKHYDLDDLALKKAYRGLNLEHPMTLSLDLLPVGDNVVISIGDEAMGLSLDESLGRMHKEFARRLSEEGSEGVRNSRWFQTIRSVLGENQASLLLAWPTEPNAFRELKVGTILDMQFIAGFGPDVWDIRSVTSGMGFWGVRYLIERLGGTVMGTNKFDGGAQFSIILPKSAVGL